MSENDLTRVGEGGEQARAADEVARVIRQGLRARYRRERRFVGIGAVAIAAGALFLLWLLATSAYQASNAFFQTYVALDIDLHSEFAELPRVPTESELMQAISEARYGRLIKASLRETFPQAKTRGERRRLYRLVSSGAEYSLRRAVERKPELIRAVRLEGAGGTQRFWFLADDEVDQFVKGAIDAAVPESERRLSDQSIAWIEALRTQGRLEKRFNRTFFSAGDSRDAEQAGILGATVGSLLTLAVAMLLAFPVGIAAAVYLQEFAPRNKFVDLVEVNINNLAAVPSIIFGLLGLAVFLNFFGFPRSVPLVGGMVLALMTLPTIIISSRAALAAVPPRIRQAALGVGASPVQTVTHHVLPLALPGMLTGAIIGLAQALGETAPLLAIGMVAFIVDVPGGFTDPATALPVQIYLWADSPERAFVERTAAAILVLMGFLALVNGTAALVRSKIEKRW